MTKYVYSLFLLQWTLFSIYKIFYFYFKRETCQLKIEIYSLGIKEENHPPPKKIRGDLILNLMILDPIDFWQQEYIPTNWLQKFLQKQNISRI